MAPSIIIFTDLDGTLIGFDDFSPGPAGDAVEKLVAAGVDVIPVSSKTAPEIRKLLDGLGLALSFVVENGAAVHLSRPGGYDVHPLVSLSSDDIMAGVERLPKNLAEGFVPLLGMSTRDQEEVLGLSGAALKDALRREYSQPFVWQGAEEALQHFTSALAEQGIETTKGGRLFHLGGGASKVKAMDWVVAERERQSGSKPITIALGDSPNDRSMLEHADLAGVVRLPGREPMVLSRDDCLTSRRPAPEGWVELVSDLLPKAGMNLEMEIER